MQNAISAGHEQTLAVAKEILLTGGNAFDAAIAAYLAMFIAEPVMASAGGNGFALTRTADGEISFFDFFCQTPQHKQSDRVDFQSIIVNFGGDTEEFFAGLGAAAMPGTVAGIYAIHDRYGTIPMKDLASPAIQMAKEGVLLDAFQAHDFVLLEPIFRMDEKVRDIFFINDKIKQKGDELKMPGMADFLDFMVREGQRGFYHGEISKRISDDSQQRGGFLRRDDFENYKVNVLQPLKIKYKDKHIYLANGPAKGGAAMALMLAYAKANPMSIPLAIERAQKIVNDETQIKPYMDQLYPGSHFQLEPGVASNRGTSHFNIIDTKGNAIALTTTLGEGCGYFIPGTNMQLNNMLGEIFLLPNGAHSWIPNTRLHSMMTPTIMTQQNGMFEFIAGSGGASRIPYSIGQVIYQMLQHKRNLEDSTRYPRYHYQDGYYKIERNGDWPFGFSNVNRWENPTIYFGGVNSILQKNGRMEAIGDARRLGVAEVF